MDDYKFDISISYSRKDAELAREIVNLLQKRDLNIFYDINNQEQLWGNNAETLKVYFSKDTRLVVALISKYYFESPWCEVEIDAAKREMYKRSYDFLLPISIDGDIPEDLTQKCFVLNLKTTKLDLQKIAAEIAKKLNDSALVNKERKIIKVKDKWEELDTMFKKKDYFSVGQILASPLENKNWFDWGGEIIQRPDLIPTVKIRNILEVMINEYELSSADYKKMGNTRLEYLGRFNIQYSGILSFSQANYSDAQKKLKKAHKVYNCLEDKFLAYSTLFEMNYLQLQEYINYFRTLIWLKTGKLPKSEIKGALTNMQTKIVNGTLDFNIQYKHSHISEHHFTVDINRLSTEWEKLTSQFKSLKDTDNNTSDIPLRKEAANLFTFVTQAIKLLVLINEDSQPKSDVKQLINQASKNFNTAVIQLVEQKQKNILDEWWYSEFASFLYTLIDWVNVFLVNKSNQEFLNQVKDNLAQLKKKSDIFSIASRGIPVENIIENRWEWPSKWPKPDNEEKKT